MTALAVASTRGASTPIGAPSSLPPDPPWSARFRWAVVLAGPVVLGLWLVGLVAFSTTLVHHAYVSADFATYNQAWTLVGQGHLDPVDTVWLNHVPFVTADFELVIWPLALLHLILPQPVTLLWVQDIAVAGCGLVLYRWVLDYLERRRVPVVPTAAIACATLAVFIANPGIYQTLLYDVHMEPISTVFILLAGRDLWLGKQRRAWIWIGIALLCGAFAAITVIGLGVSAVLAGTSTRRSGLLCMLAGVGWLGLITLVGANKGSDLNYYAYLAGRSTLPTGGGIVLVLLGILGHPQRVVSQLHSRLSLMWILIKPVGIVGLASAWGFGIPVTVMVVDALNSQYEFTYQAFQNFAVFPFVLLGTVMVLVWIGQRFRWGAVPAVAVAVAVLSTALVYGIHTSPGNIRWAVAQVPEAQAAQLRNALQRTPADAGVVATIGVIGIFGGRKSIYYFTPGGTYPVDGHPMVFVFYPANEATGPLIKPSADEAASVFVRDALHARTLVDKAGITAYIWRPPPGTTAVKFPAPPSSASAMSP